MSSPAMPTSRPCSRTGGRSPRKMLSRRCVRWARKADGSCARAGSPPIPGCRPACRPSTPACARIVQGCFGRKRVSRRSSRKSARSSIALDRWLRPSGHSRFLPRLRLRRSRARIVRLVGVPEADIPKVKAWGVSRATADLGRSLRRGADAARPRHGGLLGAIAGRIVKRGTKTRPTICPAISCACSAKARRSPTTKSPACSTASCSRATRPRRP